MRQSHLADTFIHKITGILRHISLACSARLRLLYFFSVQPNGRGVHFLKSQEGILHLDFGIYGKAQLQGMLRCRFLTCPGLGKGFHTKRVTGYFTADIIQTQDFFPLHPLSAVETVFSHIHQQHVGLR